MLGEEKLKLNLEFAYEVGKLFVKAGCSSTDLGEATEIPKSTIKRCLKTVRERTDDILTLLPDIEREELVKLQEKISEQTKDNKQLNRWTQGISFNEFHTDIARVSELYKATSRTITDEVKVAVARLVVNEETVYRTVVNSQGISLGSVHNIMHEYRIKDTEKAKESSHK